MSTFPWMAVDDDGVKFFTFPRYNPLFYRVPPGFVDDFRARYSNEPVRKMLTPGEYAREDDPLRGFVTRPESLLLHDGKTWLFAYHFEGDFALELEVRSDHLGEVRELPPMEAFAFDHASHVRQLRWRLEHNEPLAGIPVEKGPDPRHREIVRSDGKREFWRVRNAPEFFSVPDSRIEAIRRLTATTGSERFLRGMPSGPFLGFQKAGRFERDGKTWERLVQRYPDREMAIEVEVSPRPDFPLRALPPEWTWQYVCSLDVGYYPDLLFES